MTFAQLIWFKLTIKSTHEESIATVAKIHRKSLVIQAISTVILIVVLVVNHSKIKSKLEWVQ